MQRTINMKSVGIIGGLGPETTAEFYLEIIFKCQKVNKVSRPLIVTSSVPLPFEIETNFLSGGKEQESYLPFIIAEAKRLEKTGVDFLVMPCNSLHIFINELRRELSIPVLSIVEETVKHLVNEGVGSVGLISTSATSTNKLYENELSKTNISTASPTEFQKSLLNKVIRRLVSGIHLNKDRDFINTVVQDLVNQKVEAVALACTDLQILMPAHDEVEIFDTMEILALATVKEILNK
jgi:aspartate racemase